jgi:hypothetical protein
MPNLLLHRIAEEGRSLLPLGRPQVQLAELLLDGHEGDQRVGLPLHRRLREIGRSCGGCATPKQTGGDQKA